MKSIPLHAGVWCTDGPGGESVVVIVDPKSLTVTHFVVKGNEKPHSQWLVPIEEVESVIPDAIHLRCSVAGLAEMKSFTHTEFRQVEIPQYVGADQQVPYYAPVYESEKYERELVPEGEYPVRQGIEVEATDGTVGRIHDLLYDEESGQLTHFVLREGDPWGRKDVLMPISLVDTVGKDKVYLAIDKETVAATLLAVSTHWQAGAGEVEMVVLISESDATAKEALEGITKAAKQDELKVHNAAILVKDGEGNVSITETEDISSGHGALFGALTGGLAGLLGGPVGVVVGAAAGAVTGGLAARWIDMGISDEYLSGLGESLKPGSSALVILVDQASAEGAAAALDAFEGKVIRQALTKDVVAEIGAQEQAG
jgi:uncharacterized membrane protein/uncharacterized protein YrrD